MAADRSTNPEIDFDNGFLTERHGEVAQSMSSRAYANGILKSAVERLKSPVLGTDYKRVEEDLRFCASIGHPAADYWLGVMAADGYCGAADLDAAFRHWERAAAADSDEAHSTEAEFLMGWHASTRIRCPEEIEDIEAARRWLMSAAHWDDLDACVALELLERRFPSRRDEMAPSYLEKAVEARLPIALALRGMDLVTSPAPKVAKKGLRLLKDATLLGGVPYVALEVAWCYLDGVGAARDHKAAASWLRRMLDGAFDKCVDRSMDRWLFAKRPPGSCENDRERARRLLQTIEAFTEVCH